MPRSRSLSKQINKTKSRTRSLNLQQLRENKQRHNASNKIKKFIKRVNNKHKGKLAISRRNFNKTYQEQEQARRELYRQRHIPYPFLRISRPMTENELELYGNLGVNTSAPYNTEAKVVQLAIPENKSKTVKHYRSNAMIVPQNEEVIQMRLEHAIRIKQKYTRELHELYMIGSELDQGNDEATKDLDLQIKEKKEDISRINREIERLENPEPHHITTQKPVHIPEARPLGKPKRALEFQPNSRLAINTAFGINSNSIYRYAKSGGLVNPNNYRAEHIGRSRADISQEIDNIMRGRTLDELAPEIQNHVRYLLSLLEE